MMELVGSTTSRRAYRSPVLGMLTAFACFSVETIVFNIVIVCRVTFDELKSYLSRTSSNLAKRYASL